MTAPNGPVLFNSSTGSDTAASGLGPATALSGAGASTTSASAVVTGITTTGVTVGDLLWVQSSSGRQFSIVASVDSGTQVTCDDVFANTESSRTWAIGGVRQYVFTSSSRLLMGQGSGDGDAKGGMAVEMQSGHQETITSGNNYLHVDKTSEGHFEFRGEQYASVKPKLTLTGGGNQFLVYGNQLRLKDFDADWNGAGQSNDAFFYMQAGSIADGITARETGSFHIGSIFLLQGSNGTVKNCTAKGKRPIRLNGANNICRNSMLQCTDATSSAVTMGGDGGMIDSCIITSSDGGGINASAYGWNGFRGFYVKRTIINGCQSYGLLMGSTVTLNSTPELTSCIFANINGLGIDYGGMSLVNLAAVGFYAQDCGFYNNTSGNVTSGFESLLDNAVSCTADPFYDSASGDFNLSNTAGGGEALRASNKLIGN